MYIAYVYGFSRMFLSAQLLETQTLTTRGERKLTTISVFTLRNSYRTCPHQSALQTRKGRCKNAKKT